MAGDGGRARLNAFPSLPEELVKLIFEYASEQPKAMVTATPKSSDAAASEDAAHLTSDYVLDQETTCSLALVSRAVNNFVTPILYRSITLERPSQLIKFTRTLLQKPSLGLLVRNLWVGYLNASARLPPFIATDLSYVNSAKDHLERYLTRYPESSGRLHSQTTRDLVYLERGADFAAMHVSSLPKHLTRLEAKIDELDSCSDAFASSVTSSLTLNNATSIHTRSSSTSFGVERAGWGFDAAGQWIGADEWVLRCIELQHALEFHWEWVNITSSDIPADSMPGEDDDVLFNDPLDWSDAAHYPAVLPSEQRRREASAKSSSTAESSDTSLGYVHLSHFFNLRAAGYSPRDSAKILIKQYIRSYRPDDQNTPLSRFCDVDLLSDGSEWDHFLSPSLFARSGAIHLLIRVEPPEGVHAPPNAVPAQVAAFSAQRRTFYSSDEVSSDEDDDRTSEGDASHFEERRENVKKSSLDFVDVFGHFDSTSSALYGGSNVLLDNSRHTDLEEDYLNRTFRQEPADFLSYEQAVSNSRREAKRQADPVPTLGSLTGNLRALLALCPRIYVLGLNAFLERVVGGSRDCVGLHELRHLSLGPPPPFWSSALNLNQRTLASVRSLHISGCMLFRSEAMAIGGFTKALPRLKEVEWTLWLEHFDEHPINVVEAISYLLGVEDTPSRRRPGSTNLVKVQRRKALRRIHASLNIEDVEYFKQHAPPSVSQDPRLSLQSCPISLDINLQSVRRWWEKKARW